MQRGAGNPLKNTQQMGARGGGARRGPGGGGEKLMAISFVSRMRDEFYGQWMAMHVPFKKLDELLEPDIVEKVPPHLKYFACAMQRVQRSTGTTRRL